MTLTLKAMQTARRNLAQRIERLLRSTETSAELTGWQADQVLTAIEQLATGSYPEGERAMMRAEMPSVYEPKGYQTGESAAVPELRARLAAAVAE